MIDTKTPQSPGWMLDRLQKKLTRRAGHYDALFDRYEGKLDTRNRSMDGMSDEFMRFWELSHTNFAEMIVRAVVNRLSIAAIRTAAAGDELGDETAWKVWTAANGPVVVDDLHRVMCIAGTAYAMIGTLDGVPMVTAEDPRQCVTVQDPVNQSKTLYGAKFFHDYEEGRDYAFLHTPGRVRCAYHDTGDALNPRTVSLSAFDGTSWKWDENRGGEDGLRTGLDRCGIVRFRSDEGVGEFERHQYLLDRIDHMTLQGMVIATLQAFKQRAFKVPEGAMPDVDPDTGEPINWDQVLTSAPDKIWRLPESVEIWESGEVQLQPIWTGTEKYVQQLSAVTFTPLSMFSPEGQNQSAEGASLASKGLHGKCMKHQRRCGATWADVLSMLLTLAGERERAERSELVVDWEPVELYGLTEKYNAMVQAKTADVPWRTRMVKIGQFTPSEVARMEVERTDDATFAQTFAPQPAQPAPKAAGETTTEQRPTGRPRTGTGSGEVTASASGNAPAGR